MAVIVDALERDQRDHRRDGMDAPTAFLSEVSMDVTQLSFRSSWLELCLADKSPSRSPDMFVMLRRVIAPERRFQ